MWVGGRGDSTIIPRNDSQIPPEWREFQRSPKKTGMRIPWVSQTINFLRAGQEE